MMGAIKKEPMKFALAGIAIYATWRIVRLGESVPDAAAAAADAVNPVNPENIFYRGVNAVGAALTGAPGWNLGGALWDATHTTDGSNDNE